MHNPDISINSLERIEVIKGPQTAIHGAKEVSGVVNIIRKKGNAINPFMQTTIFAGASKQFGVNLSLSEGANFNGKGRHSPTFLI